MTDAERMAASPATVKAKAAVTLALLKKARLKAESAEAGSLAIAQISLATMAVIVTTVAADIAGAQRAGARSKRAQKETITPWIIEAEEAMNATITELERYLAQPTLPPSLEGA
jgi:hypothetical protein